MDEKDTNKRLEDSKKDFLLADEEMNEIVKPEFSEQKKAKIARRLDQIRKEMIDIMSPGKPLRRWLFTPNKKLGNNYFNLMVKGDFDKILENIIEIKG